MSTFRPITQSEQIQPSRIVTIPARISSRMAIWRFDTRSRSYSAEKSQKSTMVIDPASAKTTPDRFDSAITAMEQNRT